MRLSYFLPQENINILNEEHILFNDICMMQLWNMLPVSCMESTQSEHDFPYFLKVLRKFSFRKGACIMSINLGLIITQMPKRISLSNTVTEIVQQKFNFQSGHFKKTYIPLNLSKWHNSFGYYLFWNCLVLNMWKIYLIYNNLRDLRDSLGKVRRF